MIKRNLTKRLGTLALSLAMVLSFTIPAFAQDIAKNKTVSLGANLTEAQKLQMLDEFKVIADDVKIIEVTNDDIRIQLGMDRSKPIPSSSKSISSSYVEIISKGKGIRVKTNNLTEVTSTMLMNALLTSGVTDANVIASAPYPVTGTAALAGILKGFEDATGEELSLEQKEAAREEIKVTTDLGNIQKEDGSKLDKDEAAVIINDIKTEVIKDSPKNDIDIENIVVNVSNNYGVQIPAEQRAKVVSLMSDINKLDFDYNEMKSSLKQMSKNLKDTLTEMGKEIKESGILEKIWNKFKEFGRKLLNMLSPKNDSTNEDKLQYDENGNIITPENTTSSDEEIIEDNSELDSKPNDETSTSINNSTDSSATENVENNAETNDLNNNTSNESANQDSSVNTSAN